MASFLKEFTEELKNLTFKPSSRKADELDRSNYLSIEEAASRADRAYQTIQAAIKEGKLPAVKIKSRWRIKPEDLNSYIEKRSQGRDKKRSFVSLDVEEGPFSAYRAGKILGTDAYALIEKGQLEATKTESGWEIPKESILRFQSEIAKRKAKVETRQIDLSEEDIAKLKNTLQQTKGAYRKHQKALSILHAQEGMLSKQIQKELMLSEAHVNTIIQTCQERGLQKALRETPVISEHKASPINAELIAICPQTEDKGLALQVIDGRTIQLGLFSLLKSGRPRKGASPLSTNQEWKLPKDDYEYVFQLEDILSLYASKPKPAYPVLCYAESKITLFETSEGFLSTKQPSETSEVQKAASCRLNVVYEPNSGWRQVMILPEPTPNAFPKIISHLANERFSKAQQIHLITGSSKFHSPAELYRDMPSVEARKLARRLSLHYTSDKTSWMNQAHLECSAFMSYLDSQQIRNAEELQGLAADWSNQRNDQQILIKWDLGLRKTENVLNRVYSKLHQD